MKFTQLIALGTIKGLQPLKDRRYTKLLAQAAIFRIMSGHLMGERMNGRTRNVFQIEITTFLHTHSKREDRPYWPFSDRTSYMSGCSLKA